jgi:hypothetical protein
MRALIRVLLCVQVWAIAAGVSHAGPILLLQDRYQATTQITTFSGDPANVDSIVRNQRQGSIWGDTGLNAFTLTSETPRDDDFATASVGLRDEDFGMQSGWEAFAMAGSIGIGSLDHEFAGTRFDAYWEFVASDDQTTLYTDLVRESSGNAWMALMDLTRGQAIFTQQLSGFRFVESTPLMTGHTYGLATSLIAFGTGDPDVRAHVGANADFVPTPVPEPATILLLGGGAVALAAHRRRWARRTTE